MPEARTPIEVFCSYADADEAWLCKLEIHLALLKRQGLISLWHRRLLVAGMDWAKVIDTHLETASVILLFVSADFFAFDYCYGVEMRRALARQEAGEARVIPILVRAVDSKEAPFAYLHPLPTDGKPLATCTDPDAALADVAAGLRRVIEDLPMLAASAPRAALPVIWNIPYPRNPFFLGREDLLVRLRSQLQAGQAMALSQPQAISGLGGIGKTQLAVEYAYRYRQGYRTVLWVRAESTEDLVSSYVSIATLLSLPEREAQEHDLVVQAVKTWLQTHRGWLLILDNADDLTLLEPFLPPALGGHLLLTTRAAATGRLAQRVEVEAFTAEQGAVFLLRRAGLLTAEQALTQAPSLDQTLAIQITRALGGLPLALDQAGAYLEETGTALSDYLRIFEQHRATLLKERRSLVSDHPKPVATTWSLSLQLVEQRNPAAADLLRLCAFLAPDAIPEELLMQGSMYLGPMLAPVAGDSYLLGQAVEALRAFSLLSRDPRNQTLSVHRLVQAVIKDSMDTSKKLGWAQRAIRAVEASLPPAESTEKIFKHHLRWERLIGQVQSCADLANHHDLHMEEVTRSASAGGWYLTACARWQEAQPLLEQALYRSWQEQGAEHPDSARDASVLAIDEQQLGPEHLKIATNLICLACIYEKQGKYAQAEPLLVRALKIQEQRLEPEHPDTISSLNNLAVLYVSQGKYEQAEPLFQRALAIREKRLGPTHLDTATSLNNLADLYMKQGKYEQAEPLFQRALAIREPRLGNAHWDTVSSLGPLATLAHQRGQLIEARALYELALPSYEHWFGIDSPDTRALREDYEDLLLDMDQ